MKKYLPTFADFLTFSGLCFLWYGLFLYVPWISYAVTGGLLFIVGIIGVINEGRS